MSLKLLPYLLLTITLLTPILCDLSVRAWVEPGYYYGYECQLSFQFIADNFSQGENIHLSTDAAIGFQEQDYNSMFVQAADGKEYQFYSYECPVVDRNQTRTCFQVFRQMDNIIPVWAEILQPYNATHKYFLTRVRIAYCPVNHSVTPVINVVIPQSYPGIVFGAEETGVKYNKTVNLTVDNLGYRDLGWVAPSTEVYQLGCSSSFSLSWSFTQADFASSWNEARLTFQNISKIQIDVTNCAPSCQLINNTLFFTNPNRTDIPKNMSMWTNQQYNHYYTLPSKNISAPQNLAFTFNSIEQTTLNYTFSVSSRFLYNNTLPSVFQHQNVTYHGNSSHHMRFMSDENYNRYSGTYMCNAPVDVPETNEAASSSFGQSLRNFMSQFSLVILGIYCLLILIIRRIPFLLEKLVYLLLCLAQLPLTVACLILQTDQVRSRILFIFLILEQTLSKLFLINYFLIFLRRQTLTSALPRFWDRLKLYLLLLYNFRLCYLTYSRIPCSTLSNIRYERKLVLITHSIHLIFSCGAKMFLIAVSINGYLINIERFSFQSGFIVVQILVFTLSMLVIKHSLMMWRSLRAKESIISKTTSSGGSPPGSLNSGENQRVGNVVSPPSQEPIQHVTSDDFLRFQSDPLPIGVSETRGLAAYRQLQNQDPNNYYLPPRRGEFSEVLPPLPPPPSYYPSMPAIRF